MVIEYFMGWVETASLPERVASAKALVRIYLKKDLEDEVRQETEAALTYLLEDRALQVRLALADAFGAHAVVPRHIILSLADDCADTAMIVLSRSPVFTDEELVERIAAGTEEHQMAIGCRPWLNAPVVSALCYYGGREACLAVLTNPVTRMTPDDLHVMAERFGTDTEIRQMLLPIKGLPSRTKMLLMNKLGEALRNFTTGRGWLSEERAETVVADAFDRSSITFTASAHDTDLGELVRDLIDRGRITPGYLLRATCLGNLSLLAHAISQLSGLSLHRVEAMLSKKRLTSVRGVFERAGLSTEAFPIFEAVILAWRKQFADAQETSHNLAHKVALTALGQVSKPGVAIDAGLLTLLRRIACEIARENALRRAEEINARRIQAQLDQAILDMEIAEDAEFEDMDPVEFESALEIELEDMNLLAVENEMDRAA